MSFSPEASMVSQQNKGNKEVQFLLFPVFLPSYSSSRKVRALSLYRQPRGLPRQLSLGRSDRGRRSVLAKTLLF